MAMDTVFTDKQLDIVLEHVESEYAKMGMLSRHLLELHKNTFISIRISRSDFQRARCQPFSYEIVKGKASLQKGNHPVNRIEVDCFVASGKWHLIDLPLEDEIDIIKYLDQFLPQEGKRHIGLFTAQNGIQNDGEDFGKMCQKTTEKLKNQKPLFIGLHNPTTGKPWGFLNDLERLLYEWTLNGPSLLMLRQLFFTLAHFLPRINPRLLWAHIAHSEGGLMTRECLTNSSFGLAHPEKGVIKNNFIALLYGAVAPVPDGVCYMQINTYSDKDVALLLNTKYLDKAPMPNEALIDKDLLEISKQMEAYAGLKEESLEERVKKYIQGEYTLHEARYGKKIKRLNAEAVYQDLQRGKNHFYITAYPHESKRNGCTLNIVKCIQGQLLPIKGDHDFMSDTYQEALESMFGAFIEEGLLCK